MAQISAPLITEDYDFAFLPLQPTVPVAQVLEWKTDMLVSKDGAEEAVSVRVLPRRTVTYKFPENALRRAMGFNTQWLALKEEWLVPLWMMAAKIEDSTAGEDTFSATDTFSFIQDECLVLPQTYFLIWQSPDKWEIKAIVDVTDSAITGNTVTTHDFTNAYLIPLRRGKIVGPVSRSSNGYDVVTQITYDLEATLISTGGTYDVTTYTDPITDQTADYEILRRVPELSDGRLTTELQTRIDTVDGELGIVKRRYPWLVNRRARSHRFVCAGDSEINEFMGFITRRRGKEMPFFYATGEMDLRVKQTGDISTTLQVYRDSLDDWGGYDTLDIVISLRDGTFSDNRNVTWDVINSTTVELTFAGSLLLNTKDILAVSLLSVGRFASDRIEMNWIGGGVMECTIPVIDASPFIATTNCDFDLNMTVGFNSGPPEVYGFLDDDVLGVQVGSVSATFFTPAGSGVTINTVSYEPTNELFLFSIQAIKSKDIFTTVSIDGVTFNSADATFLAGSGLSTWAWPASFDWTPGQSLHVCFGTAPSETVDFIFVSGTGSGNHGAYIEAGFGAIGSIVQSATLKDGAGGTVEVIGAWTRAGFPLRINIDDCSVIGTFLLSVATHITVTNLDTLETVADFDVPDGGSWTSLDAPYPDGGVFDLTGTSVSFADGVTYRVRFTKAFI